MPQPYRRKAPIIMHPEALLKRPFISGLVAQSIASFSRAELAMASLFAVALRVDERIALEIYLGLKDSARNATFDSVIRNRLDADEYKDLSGLRAKLKSLSAWRNSFAHDIWAITPDLREHEICLVDSASAVRWISSLHVHDDEEAVSALVYTEREINEYQQSLEALASDIMRFGKRMIVKYAWPVRPPKPEPPSPGGDTFPRVPEAESLRDAP
ncbi:hypothetical protein [Enterovirga sp. CN4-39]|uniref:hypothetical protein n=1 Tax=Enterovirga sp. CN4-39 TaxID=3400910 RepID=UPI003C0BF9E8